MSAQPTPWLGQSADKPQAPVLALDQRQAAAALNLSAKTLRTLVRRGELKCCRIGRATRFAVDDLRQFLAERSAASPATADGSGVAHAE